MINITLIVRPKHKVKIQIKNSILYTSDLVYILFSTGDIGTVSINTHKELLIKEMVI